jgi:hypothetical protein
MDQRRYFGGENSKRSFDRLRMTDFFEEALSRRLN